MSSLNRVDLIGRLGKDPEVRFTGGGKQVASFSLATDESFTDRAGDKQKKTEWHRIVAWGKLAELCGEYLGKGSQVFVSGSLHTRKWKDKEERDRETTEVTARSVVFLGGNKNGVQQEQEFEGATDDDIPF